MRLEAKLQRRGDGSSPGFSSSLASPESLVAPLHRWKGESTNQITHHQPQELIVRENGAGPKSPSEFFDYMSYCDPTWVSDYSFTKSLEHLSRPGRGVAAMASRAPVRKTLVLWGSVLDDGDLHLEPPLSLDAPVKLPSGSGHYRIAGHDVNGRVLFSFDFTPDRTDHGGEVFVFAIPFEETWAHSLERVTLDGPGDSVTMDRRTMDRAAVLVDRSTGRVRSVVREWPGQWPTQIGSEAELEVMRLRDTR